MVQRIKIGLIILLLTAGQWSMTVQSKADSDNSSNNFALKLLSTSIANKKENVVLSPFSVSTALSMTANGAADTTQKAMLTALDTNDSIAKMNSDNKSNLNSLANISDKTKLNVANALFAKEGITFKQSFLDLNKTFYQAEINTCNFADPNTLKKINDWVKTKTNDKIPSILDKISNDDILYLLNAVYFKGQWREPFAKEETHPESFHLASGKTKDVKMMHKSKPMQYFAGSDFQAVYLPYSDNRLGLYVFLPKQGKDPNALCQELIATNWNSLCQKFKQQPGYLALPIVKTNYSVELKPALCNMGMGIAFTKQADFSNMIETKFPVFIGRVIHKTMLDINEAGTEAAAATAVSMMMTSARMDPEPPFNMVVDRPYLVVLADKQTNEKLFVGAIYEP